MSPVHATAVALCCADGWRAALLRGPSGAGKSDVALRLMGQGWRLVGDDYVHVFASADGLYAAPAERIAGRIEARGLGIVTARHLPVARVWLIVDCVQEGVERHPEEDHDTVGGAVVPRLTLDIRPASATAIIARAIRRL
ncbi:HPr kinase/phosphorylase [Brevundimonas bacteroides]|uniref:HPr kinase/phosphorylase n=1 Tax=Brevundimonas bacteroides TaxID=74311 RepID=UPI0004964D54|nr:HPr kinase/phosphatase C-terminal domain-containing protein [Brevundimonas bacteroides]